MASKAPGPARDGRRRDILEAALASFEELGYAASTIEDIRRRSRASVGSIYHHFGSKAAIAAALYVEGLDDYQTGLLDRMRSARDARSVVRSVVFFHLDWAKAHPAWARYLLTTRRAEAVEALDAEIRERNERFLDEAFGIVVPYMERTEILRVPPLILLSLLLGPVHEFLRLWLEGRADIALGQARELLAEAAWKSLRTG